MRLRRLLHSDALLGLALTLLVLAATLFEVGPLSTLEYGAFDWMARQRPSETADGVAVVAIDEESLDRLGDWPWPRTYIADMVRRLSSLGAKGIGLCLLYSEPEVNPGLEEIRDLRKRLEEDPTFRGSVAGSQAVKQLSGAEGKLNGDAALVAALGKNGKVVLPVLFAPGASTGEEAEDLPDFVRSNSLRLTEEPPDIPTYLTRLRNPLDFLQKREPVLGAMRSPVSELAKRAFSLGHIHLLPDPDGVIRRESLLLLDRGRYLPSLSLQLAVAFSGASLSDVRPARYGAEPPGIGFGTHFAPTDSEFRALIDFRQEPHQFSFAAVARGDTDKDAFRDKIVLVGPTAPWIAPGYSTPRGDTLPSVEVLARSLASLLADSHLFRPSWGWALEVLAILYFGVFLVLVIPRVSLRVGGFLMAFFLLTWCGAVYFLYSAHGMWLKAVVPACLPVFGFAIHATRRVVGAGQTRMENAELNRMLGLTLQGQGMLDLAFDKFMKCPLDDAMKDVLYNLGLDFERKRMMNKAVAVYRHILRAGKYKDLGERVERLEKLDGTVLLGTGGLENEATMILENSDTKPTLGRYEVIKELGQGAMGTVYLGRDPVINREVAIKTVKHSAFDGEQPEEVKRRFFREAEAAGKLSHPGIVTVYDVGEDHDLYFLAMELLDGRDLTPCCEKENLLPIADVLKIVAAVADALDYAHKNGVVHRDIKPANIMIVREGRVKVTDFGIARVMNSNQTQTGAILGSPYYMSPEQVAGRKVDGRSDLFSLGVVFYELLTGEKPFKGDNVAALTHNISKASYVPVREVRKNVPACCVNIVDRLLVRAVSRRMRRAADLAKEVRVCQKKLR